MATKGASHRFDATVYKLGILRCVDVPVAVSRALGASAKMPVSGTLGTAKFQAYQGSLASRKEGGFRLYIRMKLLREIGADTGDMIHVNIRRDPTARQAVVPADFAKALRARKGARKAYDELPPSHRREFIEWLDSAKKPETRTRRLKKAVEMVLEQSARRAARGASRYL